ncbi:paraquat-inducible protein A [Granulosicoccaceae sp. 1_MG-2023]|nr:paraquat-inducible protein A [Granulosicoccaceae sp. 1_MG-2023]
MHDQELIACHDCDLLQRLPDLRTGQKARCLRCNATLGLRPKDSLNRSLSLTITALVLFVLANTFPFLSLTLQGQLVESTLISGALSLLEAGNPWLSSLVLLTTLIFPLMNLCALLYVLLSLRFNYGAERVRSLYRLITYARPWAMLEVMLLAALVAGVKLGDYATVITGFALYCFIALILILAAIDNTLDPRLIWRYVKQQEQL